MDWVADGIALGGIRDLMDFGLLLEQEIDAVLQLCGRDSPVDFPFSLTLLALPVEDGKPLPEEMLRRGVRFIRKQRQSGASVLVACGAGVSRSPTFVAAYLHEEGMDLQVAFLQLMSHRPGVRPHPAMFRSLCEIYGIPGEPMQLLADLLRGRKSQARDDDADR